MAKNPFQMYIAYQEAKEELIEKTVGQTEVKSNPLYFLLFSILITLCWLSAIFSIEGLDQLYQAEVAYYVFLFFFVCSYFSIYHTSKLIFKPTQEELQDNTSIIAIFSACGRKEMRSFISIGLGFLHTLFFILYLINKDLGLIEVIK